MKLKSGTRLTAETRHGTPIDIWQDSYDGRVFAFYLDGFWSDLPTAIVIADSWESAYELAIDESPTIDESEVCEAYGFDDPEEFAKATAAAEQGEADWPDLIEGYSYQGGASGTGIVDTGHHTTLREIDRDWLQSTGVVLTVERTELFGFGQCQPGCLYDSRSLGYESRAAACTAAVELYFGDCGPLTKRRVWWDLYRDEIHYTDYRIQRVLGIGRVEIFEHERDENEAIDE